MNYKEFLKIARKIAKTNKEKIYIKWIIGGEEGGSCWDEEDSEPHYPVDIEDEPNFDVLDNILNNVCPSMNFTQYKELLKLTTVDEFSKNEYYGNYTVYAIKSIKLKTIFDFLVEHKLINNDA
ncbi:hypothetical protein KY334_07435 [Candidatus Woesearchaeota archaeon]|nr:hypothetical protein [Candidatus Woesearchaeota archaeon]